MRRRRAVAAPLSPPSDIASGGRALARAGLKPRSLSGALADLHLKLDIRVVRDILEDLRPLASERLLELFQRVEIEPADADKRRLGPRSAARQSPVDLITNHAGVLEPVHNHGHVLFRIVVVIEFLARSVR